MKTVFALVVASFVAFTAVSAQFNGEKLVHMARNLQEKQTLASERALALVKNRRQLQFEGLEFIFTYDYQTAGCSDAIASLTDTPSPSAAPLTPAEEQALATLLANCVLEAVGGTFRQCMRPNWPRLFAPLDCVISDLDIDFNTSDSTSAEEAESSEASDDIATGTFIVSEQNCTGAFGDADDYTPLACFALLDVDTFAADATNFGQALTSGFSTFPSCQPLVDLFLNGTADFQEDEESGSDLQEALDPANIPSSNPFEATLEECESQFNIGVLDDIEAFDPNSAGLTQASFLAALVPTLLLAFN
mmetsp:Transcript_5581/g.6388  ORF Transcript_5581/g.6388 Transcript_5581/m.6388 type:complete len:305 (-) Transcript_5581:89-1003(-)